eukprot:EG_transcript_18549
MELHFQGLSGVTKGGGLGIEIPLGKEGSAVRSLMHNSTRAHQLHETHVFKTNQKVDTNISTIAPETCARRCICVCDMATNTACLQVGERGIWQRQGQSEVGNAPNGTWFFNGPAANRRSSARRGELFHPHAIRGCDFVTTM